MHNIEKSPNIVHEMVIDRSRTTRKQFEYMEAAV